MVVASAGQLFLENMKRYTSPMKTEFIEGHLNGKEYLLSYNKQSNYYVFTEDSKVVCAFVQKKEILEALKNITI